MKKRTIDARRFVELQPNKENCTMKNFLNGVIAILGICWILLTDREQRELYNESIGYGKED